MEETQVNPLRLATSSVGSFRYYWKADQLTSDCAVCGDNLPSWKSSPRTMEGFLDLPHRLQLDQLPTGGTPSLKSSTCPTCHTFHLGIGSVIPDPEDM